MDICKIKNKIKIGIAALIFNFVLALGILGIATTPTSALAQDSTAAQAAVSTLLESVRLAVNNNPTTLADSHLIGFFDAGFLNDGRSAADKAKYMAHDNRGATIHSITITGVNSYDHAAGIINIRGTVTDPWGTAIFDGNVEGMFIFKRQGDGSYRSYGNQRIAETDFQVAMRTDYGPGYNAGPRQHVNFHVEAPVGQGVTSVSVTGPGLSGSLAFTAGSNRVESVQGAPGVFTPFTSNPFYAGFVPLSPIATGSVYTFTLTKPGPVTFIYDVPFTGTALTNTATDAITGVTVNGGTATSFAAATLSSPLNVAWTLPTGYPVTYVQLWGYVRNADNVQCSSANATPAPGATSGQIVLPSSCGSSPIVFGSIDVTSEGAAGQRSMFIYQFNISAATPPAARTISGSGANTSQAYVTWNFLSNVTYNVYRRPAGSGSYTQIATGYAFTYFVDQTGLANNTSYQYYVTAVGVGGESAASNVVTVTTPACASGDCLAPSVPTDVMARVAGALGTTSISVNWTASTDNEGVASYQVNRCLASTGACSFLSNTAGSAPSFTDTTAVAGTTYRYWTAACDAANKCSIGSSQSPNVTATAIVGSSLSINGPRAVREGGTGNFTAFLVDSGGNFTSVTPTWSVVSGPASVNSSGMFTANAVTGGQQATLSASYVEPGSTATFTASYPVLVQEGQDAWSITGQPGQGGYVRTMQIVNGSMFAGLYAGGILRSDDNGANWVPRNNGLTSSLVQGFSNIGGNTWLAALDGQGVFRSTDNMGTWTQSNSGLGCTSLRSYATQSNVVYAATHGCGVYKSADQGLTWTAANNGLPNNGTDLAVFGISTTATTGEFWAATNLGVFKSSDSGASWVAMNSGLSGPNGPSVYTVRIFTDYMLAVVEGNGVFKSSNGGNTWFQSNTGLPALHIPSGLSTTHNNTRIYATPDGHGLYVSTDQGASWQPFGSSASAIPNSRFVFQFLSTSRSRLWAGTFAGIYSSDDDGATWQPRNTGLPGGYTTNTSTNPFNANEVFATADTLYKSTDGGQTWVKANNGVRGYLYGGVVAYHPTEANKLIVTTNSQGVYRSTDGGASWSAFNTGLPNMTGQSPSPRIDGAGRLYIATNNSGIFRSTGGAAWVALNSGLSNADALNVDSISVSTGTLYAATADGLYSSINDGASWAKSGWSVSNPGVRPNQVRVDSTTNNVYWSVFQNNSLGDQPIAASGLYRSADAGATATQLLSSRRISNFHLARPAGSLVLYAINRQFPNTTDWGVIRSTDNGVTWNAVVAGVAPNSSLTPIGGSLEFYDGKLMRISTLGQGVANFNPPMVGAPAAPVGVTASVPTTTTNIQVNWTAVSGATSYNVYMANTTGVSKTNYASLAGGHVHAGITGTSFTHSSAAAGSSWYIVVTALNTAGESVESSQVNLTIASAADTQLPSVPAGLAATVISSSQINLTWTASTDNVGVTGYKVYRGGELVGSPTGASYSNTGLTAATLYSYTVQACDAVPNCSALSAAVSATTTSAGGVTALNFAASWNLVGNSVDAPLTVATTFGNTTNVSTVWKWVPATSRWAFYAPSLIGQALPDYAANKGYDVLTTINAGEGFWVNAKVPFTAQLPAGTAINTNYFADQLLPPNKLPAGWSLIAVGDNPSPRSFVNAIAISPPMAPAVAATSLTTLWAWDSGLSNWYFYAPSLDNSGGLAGYLTSKGYLDFATLPGTPIGTLSPTTGFWVNKP